MCLKLQQTMWQQITYYMERMQILSNSSMSHGLNGSAWSQSTTESMQRLDCSMSKVGLYLKSERLC